MSGVEDGLDVVLALSGADRPSELQRCMFALAMQDHAPLTIHVAGTGQQVRTGQVQQALSDTLSLNPGLRCVTHEVPGGPVAALNAALRRGTGRYVCVLRSTDVMHGSGAGKLIGRLAATGSAAAIGGVARKVVRASPYADVVLRREVEAPEGLPAALCGTVLDRAGFGPRDLAFSRSAVDPEEEFIARLFRRCTPDGALRQTVVVDRYAPETLSRGCIPAKSPPR